MYKQIAENKRRTVYVILGFVVMIAAIGGVFAWVYDDVWIAVWTMVGAIIYAVLQYFVASSAALAMTGAREISKKDNPRLYNVVENLSITTGLPMPKVYIIDDPAPNAFATGRDPQHASVAATTFYTTYLSQRDVLYDVRYASREHIFGCEYMVLSVTDKNSYKPYAENGERGYENFRDLVLAEGYEKIAEYEGRTKNKELEQMIKKRIAEFEKENGKIEI